MKFNNTDDYIKYLNNIYNNFDSAKVITGGTKRLSCYSIVVDAHDITHKKAVKIMKGSIIRSMKDFLRVESILNRLDRRQLIKTVDMAIGGKSYCIVKEDFLCTSETEAVALTALVSTRGKYITPMKKCTEIVKEAEHSLTSDETSYLSEGAQQQSARIAQLIYNENKAKEQAELEEKLKSFNYDFKQSTPYVDKVLAYNKSKLDIALFDLDAYNTLYITGLSHSGKTYLCKEIAGKYCNIDTSDIDKKNDTYYSNLMWVSCSMTVDQFTRKFAEFCVHNKNKEKCLLVLNEATKDKLCYLLPMWEYMSKDGKKFKELAEEGITFECDGTDITIPKGLRILANVADEQNKNAIEQVINRFVAHIDMNQLTDDLSVISQYTNIRKDIIELLYHMQEEMIKRYDERKAFLVVYQLKYNKKKCLEDIYTNQCSKLFGPSWEGLKTALREYIDNEI